jgi:nitrate/nitrite transporter NarK
LLSTIWTIISRPTFAFLVFASSLEGLGSGLNSFFPKYVEDQYQFTPTNASYVVSGIVIVASLLGPTLGATIMEKLKFRRTGKLLS